MRRLLEMELKNRKFRFEYPRLSTFINDYFYQVQNKLQKFIVSQLDNQQSEETEKFAHDIICDLLLVDSCLNYIPFSSPVQNISKRRLAVENISLDEYMGFMESLRFDFHNGLNAKFGKLNKHIIDNALANNSLTDLNTKNNLVELICDYWLVEAVLDDHSKKIEHAEDINQIDPIEPSLLTPLLKYKTAFNSSNVSSFIEHSDLESYGLQQSYVSLNVKCFEDPSNIPNLFTSFLLLYMNEKVLLRDSFSSNSSEFVNKQNSDLKEIYSIIENLDALQNKRTNFNASSTFTSGLISILCFDLSLTDESLNASQCAREIVKQIKQASEIIKNKLDQADPLYIVKKDFLKKKIHGLNEDSISKNLNNFRNSHFSNLNAFKAF